MAKVTKPTLKTYFNTGDVPTETNFVDLIDSTKLEPIEPTAPATTGTITLTFDQDKIYPDITQTGNITLAVAGSGNIRGVIHELTIIGNGTNTLTVPTSFVNGNLTVFDPTKINDIYLEYKTPTRIIYNVIPSAAPVVDSIAPVIQSAVSNTAGTQITLTYNEALSGTPNYTLSGGKTISSQVIAGSTVLITVTVPYVNGNIITVSGGGVTDSIGNSVATLSNYSVTNNVPIADTTAPVATFNPVNSGTLINSGNPIITVNETIYTTSGVLIDNTNISNHVELRLTNSAGTLIASTVTISGNTITIDPNVNLTGSSTYYYALLPVRDAAGNQSITQSATFTASASDVSAPVISSASVNTAGTVITLNYNETLNSSVIPATSSFITSPSKTISNVSIVGSTVLVTVTPAFTNADTITISYTAGTNKIQDVAGNFSANLTNYSVSNTVPLAQDDFNDNQTSSMAVIPRTTPIGGFGWVRLTGAASGGFIGNLNGYASLSSPVNNTEATYGFNPGKRNIDMSIKIALKNNNSSSSALCVAMTDGDNRVIVQSDFRVGTVIGGVFTYANTGIANWETNDIIRVVVTNTTGNVAIIVYQNGVERFNGTLANSSSLTGTLCGFQIFQDVTRFDDITVY